MEDILRAAGADEVITIERYAHLVGGARMAADERHAAWSTATAAASPSPTCTSPTAACCPPRAAANPALTIMAVAARAADQLASGSAASA